MQDCDYSSGCVDVYLWIGLAVILLLISFLFCCRVCRVVPLFCGNEIELSFRGSKDQHTGAANAAISTLTSSADRATPSSVEVGFCRSKDQSIGSANADNSPPSSSADPAGTSEIKTDQLADVRIPISSSDNAPQPSIAIKAGVRFLCSIALGYIIAIVIIVIIVATTTPFPAVPASACRATCAATDATCCTYSPPLAHDEVYFSSADGTQLHGWWIPSPNGSNATLLYNHGSGQNIAVMYRIQRYQVRPLATERGPGPPPRHRVRARAC